MANPLDPISKLRDRVAATLKKHGLILQDLIVRPGPVGGPHRTQMVLMLDPDWDPAEAPADDPEFDRVMREAELAEQEAKAAEVKEGLTDLRDDLKNPRGGIGLD